MSQLKTQDFEDLTLPEFRKKLQEVKSIDFLQTLSVAEQAGEDRKGAHAAIIDRIDEIKESSSDKEEDTTADEQAGPIEETKDDSQVPGSRPLEEENQENEHGESPGPLVELKFDKEEFIAKVLENRLKLDRIFEFAKAHGRVDSSPDDSIFLAKAWLGKMLGTLGTQTPYKKDEKKEIQSRADIPPTAEKDTSSHFKAECLRFNLKDTFKAAIELREMLQEVIEWIDSLDLRGANLESLQARNIAICRTQAFIHASEAKFFLGVILSNQKV